MTSQPTSHRLLLIACSASKRQGPGVLPAIERYTGMSYCVIAKARREGIMIPPIVILSAEYGLIRPDDPILHYNRKMDASRVLALEPTLRAQSSTVVEPLLPSVTDTLVCAGYWYRSALIRADVLLQLPGMTMAIGGIGRQLQHLARWLRQPNVA